MENKILEIHDKVFVHLSKILSENEGLKFSLRKSNIGEKLDRGYWFYGGLEFVAISFWSGYDNVNRTPNISFIINRDESCFLFFTARNSELIGRFFIERLYPALDISAYNTAGQARITIEGTVSYLEKIEHFILNEKIAIDNILKKEKTFFASYQEPVIGFIDGRDFRLLFNRTHKLRETYDTIDQKIEEDAPINISKLSIQNFGPIRNIDLPNFGLNKKWIFLTGENGCGKSAIFRAIATGICNDHNHLVKGDYSNYNISINITEGAKVFKREFDAKDAHKDTPKLLYKGFAAYGASRLSIENPQKRKSLVSYHLSTCDSIFSNSYPLLDLWTRIIELQTRKGSPIAHIRLDNVREVLYNVIENLKTILFPGEFDTTNTYYTELDINNNKVFPPVPYDYLASGIRSIIAMIGDLIVRFFEQQPLVLSPSDFKGIVIIDEIDVHLHPSYQKKIVETLDKIFPKIQFIVSTHSPIPLIGAPENSICYVVKRSSVDGVFLQNFDDIKFNELLPNTLFTSPIFGMESIFPISQNNPKKVRTEKSWNEVKFNDKIKLELKEIINSLNENEKN